MPFAALRGYYEVIKERQNTFEERKELSEDDAKLLSEKLSQIKKGEMIKVTYYKEFEGKEMSKQIKGGKYVTIEGMVWDIDEVFRTLTVVKTKIPFDDILDIYGSCLKEPDYL